MNKGAQKAIWRSYMHQNMPILMVEDANFFHHKIMKIQYHAEEHLNRSSYEEMAAKLIHGT
jgi:hypothetical protein